ncbi:hypothetical protein Ait01nite_028070 [Actinoplanes italicus]|uniref:Uncharacterized protein n=1 Tax=Actinoplanes italicus TaxID=113567 RepID=A0A2T0KIA8_9ACTN|nr:hypothetical protein [Actinoplanes italicus]PRX23259.1 hypothetical protein CLV67_1033 [Actinoplanes italicus]GIE29762.1 hypothetical protein Ait01nite_028070 [Actinoplanes italicus]
MSDRGQHTPSPASPAPAEEAPEPAVPAAHDGSDPSSPIATGAEIPFELSATDDGDSAFSLTGHDEPEAPAAPQARTARTIVLASLLVVALAGAGALAWFGWQVNSQRQTTLSTPAKIGALTLDDSEQATSTADYLQSALNAEIQMDKAVGAVYSGGDEKSVLFFGGTTLLWSPDSDLDSAFGLVNDEQSTVSGLKEVDPGEFGGTMKCGVAKSQEDGDMTVCGWADHGSLALAMFPNRTESEAATLMREIRAAAQTRI